MRSETQSDEVPQQSNTRRGSALVMLRNAAIALFLCGMVATQIYPNIKTRSQATQPEPIVEIQEEDKEDVLPSEDPLREALMGNAKNIRANQRGSFSKLYPLSAGNDAEEDVDIDEGRRLKGGKGKGGKGKGKKMGSKSKSKSKKGKGKGKKMKSRDETFSPFPTQTPFPTATPFPTITPVPTETPLPSWTPLPTWTPFPSWTPFPTQISQRTPGPTPATKTAGPTSGSSTAGPTPTTATPAPTPTVTTATTTIAPTTTAT